MRATHLQVDGVRMLFARKVKKPISHSGVISCQIAKRTENFVGESRGEYAESTDHHSNRHPNQCLH